MTSISSASSSNAAYLAMQKNLFSKIDKDEDGKVSKDEFVSSRPSDVSEATASELYSKMDSDNTGSLTEEQFSSGMEENASTQSPESQLSSEAMDVLMQLQQQSGMMSGMGSQASASDLYAEMDADSDGSVTEVEFVSSRPDDMSEDDAKALYATIDTEGTGSITVDQFSASLESAAGAGAPMGPPPSGGGEDSQEVFDAMDTNEDGTVSATEFLAARPDDVSEEDAQALFDSIDTASTGSITQDQLDAFMESTAPAGPMGPPPGDMSATASEETTDTDYILSLLSAASDLSDVDTGTASV
jgi:Ca2+-binding EF-hand superfamily protein